MTRYILVNGSFGYFMRWYQHDDEPFTAMMATEGFVRHQPQFRWNGGVSPIDWAAAADALGYLCQPLAVEDRNIICYSNGGQVALYLASQGMQLRTLTTVGTPCRYDVPVDRAEDHIGFHQHIYDDLDPVRWLGEVGPGIRVERHFERAKNYPLYGVGHGNVFFDQKYIGLWRRLGWLESIRKGHCE